MILGDCKALSMATHAQKMRCTYSIMNPKQKVRLAAAELSSEMKSEVDKLQSSFILYQKHIEKLDKSGELQEKSVETSNKAREKGNNLLKQKGHNHLTHHSILRWYTESIALAPHGTKEQVLGYGNRSASLMHLQHYREALIDIDRALQLTKDDEYKTKLLARKERCLGLLNKQNLAKSTKILNLAEAKELEKIRSKVENLKPSATIPCASDCAGLACNDQLGRHLVATRDIEPGEIVIIEKSYVGTPILHRYQVVCSHCVQYAWNGIPCDKCTFAIYCNETCKQEAFEEYHDIECPILKYMWLSDCSNEENQALDRIISLRILIKALRKEGFENIMKEISDKTNKDNLDGLLFDGILRSDRFKSCYNLMANSKDKNLETHFIQILYLLIERTDFLATLIENKPLTEKNKLNMAPVFYDCDSMTVNPILLLKLKEALMKLTSIAAANKYEFETSMWQCGQCNDPSEHEKKCVFSRGCVIVPTCSLINHSCVYNVAHIGVEKRKIIVYSLCPIKKGEMLCSSYNSASILKGDVKTRRQQLPLFVCKCRACVDGISLKMVMKDYFKDSSMITALMKKTISASVVNLHLRDPSESLEISEKILLDMINLSEFVHKHLNYYKAFVHSARCHDYIQKIISKVYQEEMHMPNEC